MAMGDEDVRLAQRTWRHRVRRMIGLSVAMIVAGASGALSAVEPTLLDEVNQKAREDGEYFTSRASAKRRERLAEDYAGAVDPLMAQYLEKDVVFIESDEIRAYLEDLVQELLAAGWEGPAPPLRIVVESRDAPCAFADEYGLIRICSGLLRSVEDEDALAGVMAHELAHVLLRHGWEKRRSRNALWAVESATLIGLAVEAEFDGQDFSRNRPTSDQQRHLMRLQGFGAVWSDLLAPRRTREQEREADLLALDLLHASGRTYASFKRFVEEEIQPYNITNDGKLSMFRGLAESGVASLVDAQLADADSQWTQALIEQAGGWLSGQTDDFFNARARERTTHDSPVERAQFMVRYAQTHYPGPERIVFGPEGPSRFERVLERGRGQRLLEADRLLNELTQAARRRDRRQVRELRENLPIHAELRGPEALAQAALLQGGLLKRREAEALSATTHRPGLLPAAFYLQLADHFLRTEAGEAALVQIDRAVAQLGREYRFLPARISVLKELDQIEAAEDACIACRSQDGGTLGRVAETVGADLGTASTQYLDCLAALGYDPEQAREQRREAELDELREAVQGFGKSFKKIFKN